MSTRKRIEQLEERVEFLEWLADSLWVKVDADHRRQHYTKLPPPAPERWIPPDYQRRP